MVQSEILQRVEALANEGMSTKNAIQVLNLIGFDVQKQFGNDAEEALKNFRLWGDYMPLSDEYPYTEEQRNLHILWELMDRAPLGIDCGFAVPFRQIIAKKLFKKCGEGFVANEGCRFNYGHMIELGDNVSWNAGCYIDAKGGVKMGDFAMLTEFVKIFTHSHSEWNHLEREYKPVEIGNYAKVYTNATILPGVTLGTGAIVATGAIVTKSVEDFTLVGGVPAKPMRKRKFEGESLAEMNQYMMKDGLFQTGEIVKTTEKK